jgi:ankyrin repeat protein
VEAACRDRPDLVRELLSRGADPRVPNGEMYGGDAILICWGFTRTPNGKEVARLLLDAGADVNARAACGTTPLMEAVSCYQSDVVRLLLSRGADPNARNDRGWTPLHCAVNSGTIEPDAVRGLPEYGADVNARAKDGITPLGRARQARRSPTRVTLLRKAGAKD